MINFWKLHAFSLATTLSVTYILCTGFVFGALYGNAWGFWSKRL